MALWNFDRLSVRGRSGDRDHALRLLCQLAGFGVVGHLQVQPGAGCVAHEHLVQDRPAELQEFNLDAQDDHEERVEDAAGMEVCDGEAGVGQLLDPLILQLRQIRNRDHLI